MGQEIKNDISSNQIELPHGYSRRQIAAAISPKIQEFILFPTEKCNFRCTYCYEDFELGKMSENLQRGFERLLDSRVPELKRLTFAWFGGEPLLAKEIVLRLSRYAKALCKEHGVHFTGGLTTNAYLLDETLAKDLLECEQNFFQITLDGYGEFHDRLRQRADGKGTFDVIWKNLISLKKQPLFFECVIRIHVRRDNLENLETLVLEIAKEFGDDSRFKIDFQHLRDMGGAGGQTISEPITLKELGEIEYKLRAIGFNHNSKLSESEKAALQEQLTTKAAMMANGAGESASAQSSSDAPPGAPYICYAAKPNSIAIRANGRIGKCTVALSDQRNDLGYLSDEGVLVLNQQKLHPWIRGLETLDTTVTGCPMKGMESSELISPTRGNGKIINIAALA